MGKMMAGLRNRKNPGLVQSKADQLWFSDAAAPAVFQLKPAPGPIDAPPLANDDSYSTTDTTVVTGNLLTNDTPGDVPLTVTAVNGSALAVDREIVLPSGAHLTVHANGDFVYNPSGAFNAIPTTNDVFTYTVAGGDGATVTVTVNDPGLPGVITGTDNPETLNGTAGDDVMDARGGNDTVNGFGGNDSIDGGAGADAMVGSTGNDTYYVDNAGDTVTELIGEGYDIVIANANYTLGAGVYVEELMAPTNRTAAITLHGNELDNIIRGGIGPDTLFGHEGNDILYAGNANQFGAYSGDSFRGGTGDDIYYVFANFVDNVVENTGEGYDIVYVGGNAFSTTSEIELIAPNPGVARTSGINVAAGNSNTEIRGTEFADQLNGGGGADLLTGYGGNDTYTIDQVGDVYVEAADGGIHDTIRTSMNFSLTEGGNIEDLTGTAISASMSLEGNSFDNIIISQSTGADILVGHDGNDTIKGGNGNDSLYGDAGNDSLDGEAGNDLMDGGLGNDSYFVNSASDTVVETPVEAGQSYFSGDSIVTTVSWTLAAGQQIEALTRATSGSAFNMTLTGNEFGQYIAGVSFALVNDTLIGLGGDDILDGGVGNDTMDGGTGDDIFYVDSFADVVIERAGEGRDTVYTRANYTLAAGVHVEGLAAGEAGSTFDLQLAGNEFAQEIYGNNRDNIFHGGGGADTIIGYGGNDTYYVQSGTETFIETVGDGRDIVYTGQSYVLAAGASIEVLSVDSIAATVALNLVGNELAQEIYGNNGANILRGGGGADYILGFGGDDTYYVASGAETFLENSGQGRDIVYTGQSYTLAAGTSIEVLSTESIADTTALNLVGNELAQEIYGNNGNNILRGGGGADFILGFGGDDTYYVTSGTETFLENVGQGRDTVLTELSHTLAAGSEVEILSATSFGDTGAINLTGNEFGNEIYGNAGANVLNGMGGNDILQGNGGADTFAFTTALGVGNVDRILDFATGVDKVGLDDAIFSGIGTPGAFNTNAFFAGTAAHDADDRIIYDASTGNLYYDADGNGAGAQVQFALLQPGTALAIGDFAVI
jgi:Ca2+-binding RTX toxin-like protein